MKLDLNPQFLRALNLMEESGKHLFITGKAGTGKSTLLEYFRAKMREKKMFRKKKHEDLAVLAPTGVAALNVRGQTIHSYFHFSIDVTVDKIIKGEARPNDREIYEKLKTIIIDEASMLRADLLDCIDVFLRMYGPDASVKKYDETRPFGGVQMIFIGDLHQLSPVVKSDEKEIFEPLYPESLYPSPYFFSARVFEEVRMEVVILDKVYRQTDEQFIHLLNKVRNNIMSDSDMSKLNERYLPNTDEWERKEFVITLTSTNKQANEINALRLSELKSKLYENEAIIRGNFEEEYYPTLIKLKYKAGAQIMLLNNDSRGRWVNGSIGIIDHIDNDESVWIRLRGVDDPMIVEIYVWEIYKFSVKGGIIVSELVGTFTQYPFRLAWAVTIHKSQGKTFDNVIIDVGQGAFASGQTYVALSRSTSLEGIRLKSPIKRSDILLDKHIYDFLKGSAYQKAVEDIKFTEDMSFTDKINLIKQAIDTNSNLEIVYRNGVGIESERVIIPITLGDQEYKGMQFLGVRAYCTKRKEERTFSVARIKKVRKI